MNRYRFNSDYAKPTVKFYIKKGDRVKYSDRFFSLKENGQSKKSKEYEQSLRGKVISYAYNMAEVQWDGTEQRSTTTEYYENLTHE